MVDILSWHVNVYDHEASRIKRAAADDETMADLGMDSRFDPLDSPTRGLRLSPGSVCWVLGAWCIHANTARDLWPTFTEVLHASV